MDLPLDISTLIATYNQINHYGRANGMTLHVDEPGTIRYTMRVLDEHLSSPNTCHGGVLAGLMDAALGAAALSLAFTTAELVSTVEFKMNYFHPVHLHDELEAHGSIEHAGKTLIVSTTTIRCLSRDNLVVARGLGTFNRYPATKRDFRDLLFPGTI